MKKNIIKTLKALGFLSLGALLLWLIYRDQDFEQMKNVLKNDVDYRWIWFSLILGLISHFLRTLRWNLLIEPLGQRPKLSNTFLAVMSGYLMNLIFPRMGEVARCGLLSRYEKIAFPKLLGTVVAERIIDLLMLLLFTAVTFLTQLPQMIQFVKENPQIKENLLSILTSPALGAILIGVILLIALFRKKLPQLTLAKKVIDIWQKFVEGIQAVRHMKHKGQFIAHSFFIFLLYFLMNYVCFQSFGFSSNLSIFAGLTVFVLGSFGMVAPVQGGIGAWHFMTMEGLALYGISKSDGLIYAFVVHTSMNIMLIIVGLIAMSLLPILNRKK